MKTLAQKISVFFEMIKWEHSIFALPFAYLGLFLAVRGLPSGRLFLWITIAMVSFRTMAMGLNRLLDASIDAENPRTRARAIPAGKLRKIFVWQASLVSLALFEWSAFQLSPLCFFLSPIPVFLAWVYPWCKRFTWLSHFVLGMILGIAPYGAWLAALNEWSWIPFFLALGVTSWVAGFDIIYALQDVQFDRSSKLYSFPARFGEKASLKAAVVLHALSMMFWSIAGKLAGLGFWFWTGMILTALFLAWEHRLVRSFGLKKLEDAFFTMNAIVSMTVFAATAVDLLLR